MTTTVSDPVISGLTIEIQPTRTLATFTISCNTTETTNVAFVYTFEDASSQLTGSFGDGSATVSYVPDSGGVVNVGIQMVVPASTVTISAVAYAYNGEGSTPVVSGAGAATATPIDETGGGNTGSAGLRGHIYRLLVDSLGNAQTGVSVRVLQPNSLTPVTSALFTNALGTAALSNPFTTTTGEVNFYLDVPQRVRLGITKAGSPEVFYEDVDVLAPLVFPNADVIGFTSTTTLTSINVAAALDELAGKAFRSGTGASSIIGGDLDTPSFSNDYGTTVGNNAFSDVNGTAMGDSASTGVEGTAYGSGSLTGDQSVAVGHQTEATGTSATAVGANASATGTFALALGRSTTVANDHEAMIGTRSLEFQPHDGLTAETYVVLQDASGVRWKITVDTTGHLATEPAP